ncbi:hypothetical protein A5668_01540 [Mycolicibacterium fortuitum]|nr:hypothetical protein A5668_01540 [Mycolicibacterium fortuitum]
MLLPDGRFWRYSRENNEYPPGLNGIWDTAADWRQYGYCSLLGKTFRRGPDGIISAHWYDDSTMKSGDTPLDEYLATVAIRILEGRITP